MSRRALQVHVVDLELLQAGLEGGGDVGDVGQDLGRDEELLARYTAIPERCQSSVRETTDNELNLLHGLALFRLCLVNWHIDQPPKAIRLVSVHTLGTIDMSVPKLDGRLARVHACLVQLRLITGLVPGSP